MFVRAKETGQRRVTYWDEIGTTTTYVGGNRPWRNTNPGNIGAGPWANRHGAIGKAGGFAVFPSYEIGRATIISLLKSPGYINLSIWDAIPKYSPAKENDVTWYRGIVKQVSKLDLQRKIKDLSPAELDRYVDGIERAEGKFKPGKVIKESPRGSLRKITGVKRNKKRVIVKYHVEGLGWLSKANAIELTAAGQIDAVIAVSKAGSTYLRTRPDRTGSNNIESMS